MSHIIEFSISGLAGRKEVLTQKLNRDINVFFGFNGSGKTSLLKILQSAMSDDMSLLKNVAFTSAEVKIYSITSDKIFTKTIEQSPRSMQVDFDIEDPRLLSLEDGEFAISSYGMIQSNEIEWSTKPKLLKSGPSKWQHRYLPTSRLYVGSGFRRQHHAMLSEDRLDLYFAESLQDLWSAYSSEILTSVREAQEVGLANILKAVWSPKNNNKSTEAVDVETAFARASAFLERQGSKNIIGSHDKFEQRYKQDAQFRSVVSDINEVEQRIEKAMAPRARLQTLIEQMFSGNKTVKFGDKSVDVVSSQNSPIGLHALSSGEKHLLRILIEALLARENSALIDEPEISLHIDWQRQLVEAMQHLNPSAQLILATHSPEIMADLDDSKIFRI